MPLWFMVAWHVRTLQFTVARYVRALRFMVAWRARVLCFLGNHHHPPLMDKWIIWPFRSIWGTWKWAQWISHAQKAGNRHQTQSLVCWKQKVTNMAIFLAKKAINGESRPNEFLKPKTLCIDMKVKSLACSNPKLPINSHLATQVILRGLKVISTNLSCPKNRK